MIDREQRGLRFRYDEGRVDKSSSFNVWDTEFEF